MNKSDLEKKTKPQLIDMVKNGPVPIKASRLTKLQLIEAIMDPTKYETKPRTKRASNSFLQALKEYNKDKSDWTVPKRGTPEYEQVHALARSIKKSRDEAAKTEIKESATATLPPAIVVELTPPPAAPLEVKQPAPLRRPSEDCDWQDTKLHKVLLRKWHNDLQAGIITTEISPPAYQIMGIIADFGEEPPRNSKKLAELIRAYTLPEAHIHKSTLALINAV